MPGSNANSRLIDVQLDEKTVGRRSPEVEHERAIAIYDLLEDNYFEPVGCAEGPYKLRLSLEENRLIFDIKDSDENHLGRVPLPILPFRRIIKEYLEICRSYYDAIKSAAPSRIEAIDMGRRGLHNDGSELLRERLEGKIELDTNTSRRLFTLLCVLHIRA
jgi:uncharacterized protein (UPF0262 family)